MKITINLTKEEMEHIYPYHDFNDSCGTVSDIMLKIQKEVVKIKTRKSNYKVTKNSVVPKRRRRRTLRVRW